MDSLTNNDSDAPEIDPYFDDEDTGWDTDENEKIAKEKQQEQKEQKKRKKIEEKRLKILLKKK